MHIYKNLLIKIAALLALTVNLPNLVVTVTGNVERFGGRMTMANFALKLCFSFLFASLVLFLNMRKNWQTGEKIAYFSLIYVICTVFFVRAHILVFDASEWGVRLGYYFRDFLILIMALGASNYIKNNQEKRLLELKNKSLETASLKAQLEALQHQLNPHFLFNSLNSLQSLMRVDVPKSQIFVENLSVLLRYSLETQKKHLVPFEKEMFLLEAYFFLLKIRFGDKLILHKEGIEAVKGFVPPLALQLLVENAVNHNEISTQHPLRIFIYFDKKNETLSVKNNLKPKRMPTQGAGLGLYNLNNRYELLAQKSIDIIKDEQKFEVIIPIITHENTHH
jgi:two-component system, LytTR family, sensor kinase